MPHPSEVVIVGGGLAGVRTAEELRSRGHEGPITIVGADPHQPYDRPPLSKGYLQGQMELGKLFLHPPQWYADNGIRTLLGTRATFIDRQAHRVLLEPGETLAYDALVLATGSRPRQLDVNGVDLSGVLTLRTLDDSNALSQALAAVERMVIVGGGWIGLEVAATARERGVEVTILEATSLPLGRVLGREVAQAFTDLHRAHGVDVRTDQSVQRLIGDDGRVVAVELGDGSAVAAECVLIGVGIVPNVELARDAGLHVDNGVVVDARLATDDPAIWAVGDVANAWNPTLGHRIRVEHWANAQRQPAVAAAAILGGNDVYDGLPYFFTDQYDVGMEYVGYAEPGEYDRVIIRGSTSDSQYVAFWMQGGRVLAGMHINTWGTVDAMTALIAAGQTIDAERLADPALPLNEAA